MIRGVNDLSCTDFDKYVRNHDLHFNGQFHAAFLLIISSNLQELFLVQHKESFLWMIPGGRLDIKGTGRCLLSLKDESPLQCALGEFTEETQQNIPQFFIQKKIQKKSTDCLGGLRSISGKINKKYYENGEVRFLQWKYIIYFTVLDESEMILFNSKEFSEEMVETSQCAWVPYDLIKNGDIPMSNKIKCSIDKIMGIVLEYKKKELAKQKKYLSPISEREKTIC